jgi:hypothetical protein
VDARIGAQPRRTGRIDLTRVGDQTSLFPSALLLGLPPIGLLASLPPTASPLCHATKEDISLRGQEEHMDPIQAGRRSASERQRGGAGTTERLGLGGLAGGETTQCMRAAVGAVYLCDGDIIFFLIF